MGLGESQSPSRIKARITTRKSQLLEGLPTIGQPNFGPTWNHSIGENLRTNDDISTNLSYNPPPRNSNNLTTIHVCKPGPPDSRSIPTCIVINAKDVIVYHMTRGTYIGSRFTKKCSKCKIQEHYGFYKRDSKRMFDDDCLTNEFLLTTEDTAIDMQLLKYL